MYYALLIFTVAIVGPGDDEAVPREFGRYQTLENCQEAADAWPDTLKNTNVRFDKICMPVPTEGETQ